MGEMDHGYYRREGALLMEKGERERGAYREIHKNNSSPKPLNGK